MFLWSKWRFQETFVWSSELLFLLRQMNGRGNGLLTAFQMERPVRLYMSYLRPFPLAGIFF